MLARVTYSLVFNGERHVMVCDPLAEQVRRPLDDLFVLPTRRSFSTIIHDRHIRANIQPSSACRWRMSDLNGGEKGKGWTQPASPGLASALGCTMF